MAKRSTKKEDDKKLFAFLATFLSIIGFVIALIIRRDDDYVMYYARHSLVIFVIGAVAGALQTFFSFIPIIGDIINFALTVIVVLLWLFSWIYALSGFKKEIPIVSDWADRIDL